jgi:hypothetical protein
MWGAANWNWHTKGENKLYWHWSPNNGFDMNFPIWGWNECLITYIMAASSPSHPISKDVYNGSWVGSNGFKNGKTYYGYELPLGIMTREVLYFLNNILSRELTPMD